MCAATTSTKGTLGKQRTRINLWSWNALNAPLVSRTFSGTFCIRTQTHHQQVASRVVEETKNTEREKINQFCEPWNTVCYRYRTSLELGAIFGCCRNVFVLVKFWPGAASVCTDWSFDSGNMVCKGRTKQNTTCCTIKLKQTNQARRNVSRIETELVL